MDLKEIVSIFSFLLLFHHQSHARTLDSGPSGSPLSSPSYSPAPGPSNGGCWLQSTSCRNGSLTACVDLSSTGSKEIVLFVKNEGEKSVTVNVSISHAAKAKQINMIKENQTIQPHVIKEVKIKEPIAGNSSIRIEEAGNLGICLIHIESATSSVGIFGYMPFSTQISPINGAYLLFVSGLVIAGACVFYKRSKRGDEIRYQQLEMGQPPASASVNNNVETAQGWEQGWDEDWQQIGANGASINGLSPRSITKRDA